MKDTLTTDISYVDVKTLYDAAYAELDKIGGHILTFQALLSKAETLDHAYRTQLAHYSQYRYGRAA